MIITFLYNGDSSNINEWSNFPYFITKTFADMGHEINRVNMHIKYIGTIYDLVITRFIRKFVAPETNYNFMRSKLRAKINDVKLKRVVNRYKNSDIFFVISDNFNPYRFTNKKCIMLCDWTYGYEIIHNQGRSIDKLENYYFQVQNEMMRNAYSNIILNDQCKEVIKNTYSDINLYEKHIDMINCALEEINEKEILERKVNSNVIVFLGAKRYRYGAIELVKTIKCNKVFFADKKVYFIGIAESDIGNELLEELGTNVTLLGYLDKSDTEKKNMYYDLLMDAKVCINTNSDFVSIAGLLEANYLFNPVIVSKNFQTVSYYGETIKCGYYCENYSQSIFENIKGIFQMSEGAYDILCRKSHAFVENMTWENVVDDWIKSDFGRNI